MTALNKFQAFLRDLFQLDLADLDFGIYRLLHIKHDEIAHFLDEQLPRRVTEAFERMAGDEAGTLKGEIDDLAAKIRKDVADDAILETGEINPDFQKPSVKAAKRLLSQYDEKWEKLKSIQASDSEQNDVFNHLYAFFSRYYDNGDFIPRRRYGARETYAVPYNGEETLFHWANRDQHYVKTGERFRD
jgi:adenine-specific DNA-methyltransferase